MTERVEVFFDGACSLCRREIALLRRLDRGEGRIRFTDIDAPEFDPSAVGKTRTELMAQIYGRLPDRSWITGVDVFRELYSAVGFAALVAPTRWPIVRQVLDVAYAVFAKNRLRLTGRCNDASCQVPG